MRVNKHLKSNLFDKIRINIDNNYNNILNNNINESKLFDIFYPNFINDINWIIENKFGEIFMKKQNKLLLNNNEVIKILKNMKFGDVYEN